MTYIIAGLGLLAGLFYGMWQRSRAERFERELKREAASHAETRRLLVRELHRLEMLVASLKAEVERLEEQSFANATPEQLRARLDAILRPHT